MALRGSMRWLEDHSFRAIYHIHGFKDYGECCQKAGTEYSLLGIQEIEFFWEGFRLNRKSQNSVLL